MMYLAKLVLIFLLIMIVSKVLAFGQECKKLDDGQYRFKFKSPKKDVLMLTINGNSYFITKDNKGYSKGKIEWWGDNCMFKLVADEAEEKEPEILPASPATDYIKVLLPNSATVWRNTFLSRSYCYELIGGRKFRLTYCDNIHITSGEGRIKKK